MVTNSRAFSILSKKVSRFIMLYVLLFLSFSVTKVRQKNETTKFFLTFFLFFLHTLYIYQFRPYLGTCKKVAFSLAFVVWFFYHDMRNKQQIQQENGFYLSVVCSIFAVRKRTKGRHKGTAQNETRAKPSTSPVIFRFLHREFLDGEFLDTESHPKFLDLG